MAIRTSRRLTWAVIGAVAGPLAVAKPAATQPAAAQPAAAQGQLLDACSRGNVQVCFTLLARPRLDAGRRAAIEFHLAELEQALVACTGGDAAICAALAQRYPDLPADLRTGAARLPKSP